MDARPRSWARAWTAAAWIGLAASWGGCEVSRIDDAPPSSAKSRPGADPGTPQPPQPPTQAPTGAAIEVKCQSDTQIPGEVRREVSNAGKSVVQQVRAGRFDGVWGALHPAAKRPDQKQRFIKALEAMQTRLEGAPDDPTVDVMHYVAVAGGSNDMARVTCKTGLPDETTLMANVGGEDIAVVILGLQGKVFGFATTVTVRKSGDDWRLVGVQVNPAAYRGKRAADFETRGDGYEKAGKPIAAYLSYGVAQTLVSRGAALKTALSGRIERKLAAVQSGKAFAARTATWKAGGSEFEIHRLSLASTQNDISPVVKYVARAGLAKPAVEAEADQLIEYLRTTHPELASEFDAVVFEAYAERPTQRGKDYQAFRVVRFFDAARNKG